MSLSWLEINQNNLHYNLSQFKKLAPRAEIWPVIKGNAYGHGLIEVLNILESDTNATGGYMVANLSEALVVSAIATKPIMVLSYFEPDEDILKKLDSSRISLAIYDLDTARYLDIIARHINKKFLVNLKIDTGTSRLGFRVEESGQAIKHIKALAGLEIYSIFTHFAESEAEDQSFTQEQLGVLLQVKKDWPDFKYHAACSAAAVQDPANHLDIIRLGLSLYGLWPSSAAAVKGRELGIDLKPVLSWKTKIIQIKNIKNGETVGYDRTFRANKNIRLAVLPVGYYEGYDRSLSNKGQVIINGYKCPVRGKVCMNLTMVELVSGCRPKVGDTAVLIGEQDSTLISAEDLAAGAGTINYEIVSRINPLLARRVL